MRKRITGIAAALLGLASVLTAASAAQKIDPRVRERAQSSAAVPVFIVLQHQPQREIVQRTESANALYREVAESRYRRAADRALGGAEELRQAREAAEAVVLRTRQQAFQAIEQAVGPEQDALEGRLKGLGATRISRYLGVNMVAAEIPASAIAALEADPAIAQVFPVEKLHPELATSVPALGAPAFWSEGYTGQGESVAVLDTGVRTDHPAFAGVNIVSQVFLSNGAADPCFTDNADSVIDLFGHGTVVAGVVASQGSAGWTNYIGVAKGLATLYNLKTGYKTQVSDACGQGGALGDPRDILAGLDWAVRNTPVKIFNLSFGNTATADDDGFAQAIDQYIDNYGLVFAIAAGNAGPDANTVATPAIAYNDIAVGAWVQRFIMAPFSSSGPTLGGRIKPDLAAPGVNIYSPAYNWDLTPGTADDFVAASGTSLAAPHIAGAAALIGSAGVTDSLAVKALLINTATESYSGQEGRGYADLTAGASGLYYDTGSLTPGQTRYYRVSPLLGHSTVVWNRHVNGSTSSFNPIQLTMYETDDGFPIGTANDPLQNVQTLGLDTGVTDGVLGVSLSGATLSGVSSEPFAIAFGEPVTPIAGPKLSISCSLPATVTSASQFDVICSAANSGDVDLSNVTAQVILPAGFSGPAGANFGNLPSGGASAPVDLTLTAPEMSGTYNVSLSLISMYAFGLSVTATYPVVVQPAVPPPALVSPANGVNGVSANPTLSWKPSGGATAYDVYFGNSTPPPLLSQASGTTYVLSGLNPGALYYWRIAARNGTGTSSSPIWSFTTQAAASSQRQYIVTTVAGGPGADSAADTGPAINRSLNNTSDVALDANGNLYVTDTYGGKVLRITPDEMIHLAAGNGKFETSGDGGPATSAGLGQPDALTFDRAGNLYIVDGYWSTVRKVMSDGTITTVAGDGEMAYGGDGGPATAAQLGSPAGVAVDASGNIYIADTYESAIRKVDTNGIINTIATLQDSARPAKLAVDATGAVYIADWQGGVVGRMTPNGSVTTIAGTSTPGYSGDGGPAINAQLNNPQGVALDGTGNIFISDSGNERIRRIGPDGIITTIAGTGVQGYADDGDGGAALSAQFYGPHGLTVDPTGRIYVADSTSVRVLLPLDPTCAPTLSGATSVPLSASGGTVPFSVQTGPGCAWVIAGLPSWISSQTFGQGPATVNLAAAANTGPFRTATISVAGTAVTIMQGESACTDSQGTTTITVPAAGGSGSVAVPAGPSCPWAASSPVGWMTLTGPTSGIGSGMLNYSVGPNPGGHRSATLTVGGIAFDIQQDGPPVDGLGFIPVTPCRLADTRYAGPAMAAGEARSFHVSGNCGIPATAQAYALNVTVVPQGPLSYLTLWPTGQDQPLVSTLNSFGGIVVANAAIVPAGFNGAVSVYVTDPTDVILDINGYFDSPGSYAFYPVQPCRVADTRDPAGVFGGPGLSGAQSRDFPVPSSSCGLPASASAYSMNVTVVPGGYLGYLKAWPTGQAQPNVSTLNSWTGKVVANAAIVPAGSGGSISVYAEDATQVVLDTNGYFGAPGGTGALNFYPVAPCRVADTRGDYGPLGGPKMGDGETRSFPIPWSGCGIPATAAAYSLNVTVVPDGMLQYLTAWPTGAGQPFVSTLNSWDGAVVANAAIVPAGTEGAISVFVANRTQVILDINGYFAP